MTTGSEDEAIRSCLGCANAVLEVKVDTSYLHCSLDKASWANVESDHSAFCYPAQDMGSVCTKFEEGHPVELIVPLDHFRRYLPPDLSECTEGEIDVLERFKASGASFALDDKQGFVRALDEILEATKDKRLTKKMGSMPTWGAWA